MQGWPENVHDHYVEIVLNSIPMDVAESGHTLQLLVKFGFVCENRGSVFTCLKFDGDLLSVLIVFALVYDPKGTVS